MGPEGSRARRTHSTGVITAERDVNEHFTMGSLQQVHGSALAFKRSVRLSFAAAIGGAADRRNKMAGRAASMRSRQTGKRKEG
jgi:hypothetical protein